MLWVSRDDESLRLKYGLDNVIVQGLGTAVIGGIVGSQRAMPVVPSTKGGPTRPSAPGIPGTIWQTAQPARVTISPMGSSPVTNGIVSGVSVGAAEPLGGSVEVGGSRSAHTAENVTSPMAIQTTSRSRVCILGCLGEGSSVRRTLFFKHPSSLELIS